MIADRGKKSKITEEEDSDHIDADLVLSIEKLQEVQDQLDKVNEEASEKVLEVEQKYNGVRRPVYVKRNEVIKSIPDFWLTAFLSHPALCDRLSEEDTKICKYLDSIDVEDFKDVMSGYSITLNFKSNPYFEDAKLTKSFTFSDEGTTKITGTNIKWKEGMNVIANGVDHEKQGNKRPPTDERYFFSLSCDEMSEQIGQNCQIRVSIPFHLTFRSLWQEEKFKDVEGRCPSSLQPFSSSPYCIPLYPTLGTLSKPPFHQAYTLKEYQLVAEIIKEDLWPNPLKYFVNEADEEDSDGDEDEDEEEEKGDDEQDDEDKDGDEEEDN
ncbi:hypothetical protein C3L33_01523, partial [Rhododendron williamsianum]